MSTTDIQRRILLESTCAATSRDLEQKWRGAPPFSFVLFMFDYEPGGNMAYAGTGAPELTRAAVARWLAKGECEPIEIQASSVADAVERAQAIFQASRYLAEWIKERCLPGTGFSILVFNDERNIAYTSTGEREGVVAFLTEWLKRPVQVTTPTDRMN